MCLTCERDGEPVAGGPHLASAGGMRPVFVALYERDFTSLSSLCVCTCISAIDFDAHNGARFSLAAAYAAGGRFVKKREVENARVLGSPREVARSQWESRVHMKRRGLDRCDFAGILTHGRQ